jgi:tetratricopeptide (TPR) repeat protein
MQVRLSTDGVLQHRQLIFITHSMGGLVARDFLLKFREMANKTQFILFLATPATGAEVAHWATLVSHNTQFRNMKLVEDNDYLKNIMISWQAARFLDLIPSYCMYETEKTSGSTVFPLLAVKVVPMESACALCNRRLVAVQTDHIRIAKPFDQKAIQYLTFKDAFTETSPSKAALVDRGIAHIGKGDYDRAIEDFNGAIQIDSKYVPALKSRGWAYEDRASLNNDRDQAIEDYTRAIEDYTQAIGVEHQNAEHYYNRGYCYLAKDDYDRAIEDFTQAITFNFRDKALPF